MRPLIVAHRGASKAATENTVKAFQLARDLGADWVELDVRLSSDGECAVVHDELAQGVPVAQTLMNDLQAAGVLTLALALDACSEMGVNVELKGPAEPDLVAERVASELAGRPGPFLVSSFWPPLIESFRSLMPEIPTGLLSASRYDPDGTSAITAASASGFDFVLPQDNSVSEGTVRAAHRADLSVITWTVDDPSRIRQLARFGVDGIITNEPGVAVAALEAHGDV